MSAFTVSKDHIDYLVQAAMSRMINPGYHGPFSWVWNCDHKTGTYDRATLACNDYTRANEVGKMLWEENYKSFNARYQDTGGSPDYLFQYNSNISIDPVQVIKACHCYRYQACEHAEWEQSEACAFIDHLISAACHVLPGYDDAQWEIRYPSKEELKARCKANREAMRLA